MIVAAEASSSLFAQRLLEHWKKEKKDIKAFGVGSDAMEALGFERLGKSEEMAVVGIMEVIEHYPKLKAVFNSLVEAAKTRRPDVVVVLDYPDFNLMLAKKMHALGIPVVYYISPQVWAWRKKRVNKIKKYCKKVLVLFPFEVDFYKEKQVPCEFVGHPLLDEMDDKYFTEEYRKNHRHRYGIKDDEFVIGLMPGSRRSELNQHMQIQLDVAKKIHDTYEKIKILILVAPSFSKEQVQEKLDNVQFPFILLKDDPFEMIHLADYILVASGTATLQVGLLHKPMVIMYRVKWLTGVIASWIVGKMMFGLVNLVLGRMVVPEVKQEQANVDNLFSLMRRYLDDPEHTNKVRHDLSQVQSKLGDKGATKRVALALEEYLR